MGAIFLGATIVSRILIRLFGGFWPSNWLFFPSCWLSFSLAVGSLSGLPCWFFAVFLLALRRLVLGLKNRSFCRFLKKVLDCLLTKPLTSCLERFVLRIISCLSWRESGFFFGLPFPNFFRFKRFLGLPNMPYRCQR